ncbi:helix-turn-helix domain-containing protein [Pedobacter endophyticus]|uniref:Helix-turn-helix transcriptional regulator n=1 Tax=Pedobacter endophyticus TaxID=2789740 RepID=A0A7S9L0P6_9SPHI|nr:AraC family transcriptional regulator [Pedobacter endophyticus]QPH40319.1 helix-turn-helix transcriptional regulator [Pedobacter endophyticus]
MKIKFSEYQTGQLIYSHELPKDFETDTDIAVKVSDLTMDGYAIKLTEKWFAGIHLSIAEIRSNGVVDFSFEASQNHICFLFCLSGGLNYYTPNKTTHLLSLKANQHSVTCGELNNAVFSVSESTQYIYIQLTTEYYKKITNQNFNDHRKIFFNQATSPQMVMILKKLAQCNYSGRVERIYLESKILGLIIFFIQKRTSKLATLKTEDLNKIALAKKIVEDNLQKPFSLIELSRKAGINDYKLKKGFKEVTGLTVFGYIFKLRMENANYLLLQEQKTVNEVAFLVGYKNAQHFIAAFKRHFNMLPGALKNKANANV